MRRELVSLLGLLLPAVPGAALATGGSGRDHRVGASGQPGRPRCPGANARAHGRWIERRCATATSPVTLTRASRPTRGREHQVADNRR